MAAVILPFSLGAVRQDPTPASDVAPPVQGRMTLDLDGDLSPLRGKLPVAGGGFAPAVSPRRVPADAILAIGRRIRRAASLPAETPQEAAPARARMPRKHKLMLLTAAAVLYTGGLEARRNFKPRAVMIEAPNSRAHAIAALPLWRPAA